MSVRKIAYWHNVIFSTDGTDKRTNFALKIDSLKEVPVSKAQKIFNLVRASLEIVENLPNVEF